MASKNATESAIARFREMYDDLPVIIVYKNLALEILYCNKFTSDYVGYNSPDKVIGKTDYDLRWERFADLYTEHEKETLKNKINIALYPTCDANDKHALVFCHKFPIFGLNKEIIGCLSHAHIIQDSRSLELSNILRLIESSSSQSIYSLGGIDRYHLTEREHECLFFAVRGKTTKRIAEILGISSRTVEKHLEHLKIKFGCLFKNELIEKAVELGYLYDIPATLLDKIKRI